MSNEEKILAMLTDMQGDIKGIKADVAGLKTDVAELKTDVAALKVRVAHLETDVAELKEGQEVLLSNVNRLVEWADECGNVINFPLPKI